MIINLTYSLTATLILAFVVTAANAGGNHHHGHDGIIINAFPAPKTINYQINMKEINDGIASAASNDHSFDFATNENQLDINCVEYKGSESCSTAYARAFATGSNSRMLIRASISGNNLDFDDAIKAIGIGLRF